jgi:hypothetical protein
VNEKKSRPNAGKIAFGIILFTVGIFMLLYSRTFPKVHSGGDIMTGPGFFPTVIGIILILFGIYTTIVAFLSRGKIQDMIKTDGLSFLKSREFQNFLIIICFAALYPTIIDYLGFFIGTFLFCFLLMKRLQAKLSNAIVSSVILVFLTWIIFRKIAFISFPTGTIFTGR